MRQYSIQSVLDWLDFKGLLKNRSYAEANVLCDLNSKSRIQSLIHYIQPLNLFIICFVSFAIIFTLDHIVPESYQSLAFIALTLSVFSSTLLPQKPLAFSPIITGSFIAIGFECAYLTMTGVMQAIYHQVSILNILLHISLLLIFTLHLFILQRDNNFHFDKRFFALSFILSAFVGLVHPAILIASLIALTSYKQANLFMVGFGLCLAALFSGWFIYNLDFSWQQKSILMMSAGLILLFVQSMVHYFEWQDEG